MNDPWESLAGVLPTRIPDPEVATNVLDAAMLCGAITHPEEASELRRLVITGVKLATLDGLEQFPALDELELRGTLTSRLDGIERAPALQHLTAWGVNLRSLVPLAALQQLRTLRLMSSGSSKISSLDGVEKCRKLRHLEVKGSAIHGLEPLAKLSALRVLDVSDTKVTSLAGIEKLQLTRLDVSSAPVADLAPLAKMRSLRWLDISDTRIKEIGSLAKLDELRVLTMVKVRVRDLAPLAGLSRIVELTIGRSPISKAAPLTGLTALRTLSVWDTKIPQDEIEPLLAAAATRARQAPHGLLSLAVELGLARDEADAAELTHFDVRNEQDVADLADLDRMPALLYLALSYGHLLGATGGDRARLRCLCVRPQARLSLAHLKELQELVVVGGEGSADVQPLDLPRGLRVLKLLKVKGHEPVELTPELRSVEADECRLTRLPEVQHCSRLVHLTIAKSYIRDASPLAGHPALRSLELPHNRIEDVAPLAHVRELRRVDLDANPVTSIDPLSRLTQLRWVSVRQTPVANRTPRLDGATTEIR